jgi:hypothetical protein
MSNEEAIRQDIEDMGCVQYLESELFIISQYSTYSYLVQVESRTYMEQKMPFAGAGLPGDPPSAGKTNFGTDIFQLGFILWLLAEHRWNPLSYYCPRNACTSSTRYSCKAGYTDPVDLPRCCSTEVPKYFRLVIRHCRQTDQKARIPARELVRLFPQNDPPPGLADLRTKYLPEFTDRFNTHCTECGTWASKLYYHCRICDHNDFDLCPHCVEQQRIHCYAPEHQLVKMITSNGKTMHVF